MNKYYWAEKARQREHMKAIQRQKDVRDQLLNPFQRLLSSSGLVNLSRKKDK